MKKLIAIALMVPAMAYAEFRTGNQLLTEIQSDSVVERMVSLGYIMAVTDTLRLINHCPPNNVTAGQLQDMVKNYLTNNPQTRHQPADTLVLTVLRQAWPCANNKGGTRL